MQPHRMPTHRRFTIAGWICAAILLTILVADQACKLLHMPRVEQWPFFGIPLTLFPVPLLAGAVLCLPLSAMLRRRAPHPPHCCRSCDYDRRGLDADFACPECGVFPLLSPDA